MYRISEKIAKKEKFGILHKEDILEQIPTKYCFITGSFLYKDKYKGTTIIDGIKIVLDMFWWKMFNEKK